MSKPTLIVDGNNVLYRMSYALLTQSLSVILDETRVETGPTFLTFKTLVEIADEYDAVPLVCWDPESGRGRLQRRKIHKGYKSGREPANEIDRDFHREVTDQREIVQTILGTAGVFQTRALKGWEADDVIARLARQLSRRGREVLILSNDKDLVPLLALPGVRIVAIGSRKWSQPGERYEVRDEEWVKAQYEGLTPDKWIEFRSLAGDPSDKVQGVKGIGKVWGVKLVQEYGSALEAVQVAEKAEKALGGYGLLLDKGGVRRKLLGQTDQVKAARKVLTLNYRAPFEWLSREGDRKKTQALIRRYRFRSFMAGTLRVQLNGLLDAIT